MIVTIVAVCLAYVFVLIRELDRRQERNAAIAERKELLNRLMARSYEQFHATTDTFLAANPPEPPRRVLWDDTGLLEIEPSED